MGGDRRAGPVLRPWAACLALASWTRTALGSGTAADACGLGPGQGPLMTSSIATSPERRGFIICDLYTTGKAWHSFFLHFSTLTTTKMSVNPMCSEAQFFGFTPQTCVYRVYIALEGYLFETMLVVEKVILKKLEAFPSCKISPFQVRESTEKYLRFMNGCFNHLFGKLEHVLLSLLSIPKNALLPGDQVHEQYPYSKPQVDLLQRETEQLQQQCKAEAMAKAALLAELEQQMVVQKELEKVLQWFDGLDNVVREQGINNLKESFVTIAETSRKLKQKRDEVDKNNKRLKLNDTNSSQMNIRTRQQRQDHKK